MTKPLDPIFFSDSKSVCDPFFDAAWMHSNFGSEGHWFGKEFLNANLRDPVSRYELASCFAASPARRSTAEPVAWKLTLAPGPVATGLWAIADKESRDLVQKLHQASAEDAFRSTTKLLAAAFVLGTDERRLPRLRTEALLLNLTEGRARSFRTFSSEEIGRKAAFLANQYSTMFGFYRRWVFSEFDETVGAKLKKELFQDSTLRFSERLTISAAGLSEGSLVRAWQEEGKRLGFGEREARMLLRTERARLRAPDEAAKERATLISRARGIWENIRPRLSTERAR